MAEQQWTSTEVLAWSRADGPDRPAEGPSRWALGAVGATLALTVGGILASDTFCPEHRAWVQGLAVVAITLSIASVVQLLRAQASAGVLALGASLVGVAIGAIDAVHAPARGWLIAGLFGFAALASAGIALRLRALRAWDDRFADAHRATGTAVATVGSTEAVTGSVDRADAPAPAVRAERG